VGHRPHDAHALVTSPGAEAGRGPPIRASPSTTLRGGSGRPSCLDRGRRQTDLSTVVPNPRISAGSIVGSTGPVSPQLLALTLGLGRLRGPLRGWAVCSAASTHSHQCDWSGAVCLYLTTEVISTFQMSRAGPRSAPRRLHLDVMPSACVVPFGEAVCAQAWRTCAVPR
jgi:hypothetical protein